MRLPKKGSEARLTASEREEEAVDFSNLLDATQSTLGDTLPGILGALLILVGGWLVAIKRLGTPRGEVTPGKLEV